MTVETQHQAKREIVSWSTYCRCLAKAMSTTEDIEGCGCISAVASSANTIGSETERCGRRWNRLMQRFSIQALARVAAEMGQQPTAEETQAV